MRYTFYSFILILSSSFLMAQGHDHEHAQSMEFIKNDSQWNSNVRYKCAIGTGAVFIESNALTYSFFDQEGVNALHDLQQASREEQEAFRLQGHAWKMHFIGGQNPQFDETGKKDHYYNYFIGKDESKWSGHVPAFERIRYQGIYPGVDIELYSHENNLKYDFILAPGIAPDQIAWKYEGLDGWSIDNEGLLLETSVGQFIESRPYAYQMIGGMEVEVTCHYVMRDGNLGFEFPDGYDPNASLIIDPELIAATLSGSAGGGSNYGHCASFDLEGNIFTGCVASGSNYPTTPGAFSEVYGGGVWDIGISKLTPDGTDLLWATYIGGESSDYPHSLISNNSQELYVYGSSSSSDFPTTAGAYQENFGGVDDIIIAHIGIDGSTLIGSTYLGGSATDGRNQNSFNYGDTYRGEIILDYDTYPIITSCSSSANFPVLANAYQSTLGGGQDAVIVKLNPGLTTLQVSTYLGGDENDTGYGIRTSVDGSIYVGGGAGDGFPTTASAYQTSFQGPVGGWNSTDGFISKLNAAGSTLIASTYFGTEESDQIFFIDLDFDENIFAFGQGGSTIPVVGAGYVNPDGLQFVSKFNGDLDELMISSTIGGSGFNTYVPDAFLVDNCDNIYISAYNADSGLETTSDALFETGGFYLAVYEADMADIIFGTYYTGNHVDGGTSRFDKNGIVYQGVCSGGGFSTTADAWATDQNTSWDIGVFKINFDASGVNAAVAANDISGCAPFEITFENFSVGDQFLWDFGDGNTSTEYAPTYIYDDPGVYTVSLIASDSLSCNLADTTTFEITISTPQDFTPSFEYEVTCADQTIICENTTGLDFLDYNWDMGDGTLINEYDATHQYDAPGDYTITLIAIDNGCDADEEILIDITIEPSVNAVIDSDGLEACNELDAVFANESENAISYSWNFGDGTTSTDEFPTHTFTGPASFQVILTATNPDACNITDQDTVMVTVGAVQTLEAIFELLQTDCEDFIVESDNQSVGINCEFTWDMGDGTLLEGENITHSYDAEGSYNVTMTMTDTLCDIMEEMTVPINVTSEVVAFIDNGDITICATNPVEFESSSVGTITWDFGDGSPQVVGSSVSHLYADPGDYIVTISVEGTSGCSGIDDANSMVEVVAPPVLIPDFDIIPTGQCVEMNFDFVNMSEGPVDIFYWEFGDDETSDVSDPSHIFSLPGTYDVTFTIWNSLCEIEEQVSQTLIPNQMLDYELEDTRICPEIGTVSLDALVPNAVSYTWSNGDDTQVTEVDQPGTYVVQVIENGCWYSDDIEVLAIQVLELSRIVTQCQTNSNTIVIPYDNAQSYLWENGVEEQFQDITESGLYPFSMIDTYGCQHAGTIDATIEPNEAVMFIPNSFTPNGDGINDFFQPVTGDLQEYNLRIYDRWGTLVFETKDVEEHWVGGVQKGEPFYVPDGVYTYTVEYRSICSTERIREQGAVTVLR